MTENKSHNDITKFWTHISLNTKDETLIVLKGHLLLEDFMREYCASKVKYQEPLNEAKLTFKQILLLTKALHDFKVESWVWPGLDMVNSLRNKLAHNLEPADYEKKRQDLVNLVRNSAGNSPVYVEMQNNYEQVAVSIFFLYTTLSISLRFKPRNLLLAEALQNYG